MKPKVSIIIVSYKAKKEIINCLKSIKATKLKVSSEVIVVDNDEKSPVKKELIKHFPWVKYIKAPGNIGFGAGNNLAASEARGKYLLFLNPDTLVLEDSIDILLKNLEKEEKVGIITPQLLDEKRNIDPLQCTHTLTPTSGLVAHSLINKLLPNNPISRKYWMLEWGRDTKREVKVVQGAAFMVKKILFDSLSGFDEKFFMFFEESDFCLRAGKIGWKILFEPQAKIIHLKERSTKNKRKARMIFKRSRTYYFKKHFGLFKGVITQCLFWIMEQWKLTIAIFLFAASIFAANILIK